MVEMEHSAVHKYLDFQPFLHAIAQRQIELMAEKGFKNE